MSVLLNVNIQLTDISCGVCGGVYGLNEKYVRKKESDGGGWHCPYCETDWGYFGETEAQKLKAKLAKKERQLEIERKRHEWTKKEVINADNRTRAQKAAKTKLKNRIKAGVCPCCKRTFSQLANHMKNKHPEFNKQEKTK